MNWVYCTKNYDKRVLDDVMESLGKEAHLEIIYTPYSFKELQDTIQISFNDTQILVGKDIELNYGGFDDIKDIEFFKAILKNI